MLRVIENYTLADVKDSIIYLLDLAAKSFEVRQHAIEISADSQDKIAAVYDWVKAHVSYVPDPIGATGNEIEMFISPVRMVEDFSRGLSPAGDCDDHALLLTALYRALGMKSNVVLVDFGSGISHAYCRVKSEKLGEWIVSDTTSDTPLGWIYKDKVGETVV